MFATRSADKSGEKTQYVTAPSRIIESFSIICKIRITESPRIDTILPNFQSVNVDPHLLRTIGPLVTLN